MEYIKYVIALVITLGVGIGIGRYLTPAKIQEKIVEKEVTKTVEHTVTIIKKNPDGSTTTTITDDKNTQITDNKQTDIKVTASKPDWRVYAGTGFNFNAGQQTYIAGVDRRIIGDVTLGVYGTTNKEAGVTIGISF